MKKLCVIAFIIACVLALAGCMPSPQGEDGAAEAEVNVEEVAPVEDESNWVLTKSVKGMSDGSKTVKEYNYIEEGKVIEETESSYNSGGERSSKTVDLKTYNDAGSLIEHSMREMDELDEVTREVNDENKYDESGSLISKYSTEREGGELREILIEYECDSEGNPTREDVTSLRNGSKEASYTLINEREYDSEGNLMRVQQFDERDGSAHVDTYEYDDENRVVRENHAGPRDSTYIETTQEYAYDDHGEKTWEYTLNLYDGEVQWESEFNYLNVYEGNQKLCSILDPETGEGRYYAYDKAGHQIQEVLLAESAVASNKTSIYDDNGLLLLEMSSISQETPDVTTYDYENLKTGQKVSGALYAEEKYYGFSSPFSVGYPTSDQVIMDVRSIYAKAVGNDEAIPSVPYERPDILDFLVFDPTVNTDPAKASIGQ